jgi:hypothetical protein
MNKTYTLVLTEADLDLIYHALYEFKICSEADEAVLTGEVMEKLFVQTVVS